MALVRDESAVSGELMVRMQNLEVTAGDTSMEIYLTVPENLENVGDFLDFHIRTKPETYSLEKEQVILTEKAASDLGVEVGDTVTLEDDGMGVKEVTIDAICENYMGHYLYLSPDYYRELFGKEAASNGMLFKMKEGQTDQIEAVGGRLLGDSNVLNVSYTSSIEDRLDDMLQSLNLVIVVLIISAGMLAFIVLYNLNTINITERRGSWQPSRCWAFTTRRWLPMCTGKMSCSPSSARWRAWPLAGCCCSLSLSLWRWTTSCSAGCWILPAICTASCSRSAFPCSSTGSCTSS